MVGAATKEKCVCALLLHLGLCLVQRGFRQATTEKACCRTPTSAPLDSVGVDVGVDFKPAEGATVDEEPGEGKQTTENWCIGRKKTTANDARVPANRHNVQPNQAFSLYFQHTVYFIVSGTVWSEVELGARVSILTGSRYG